MGDWDRYVGNNGEIPESWFAPDKNPHKRKPSNKVRGSMQGGIRSQGAIRRFDTFEEALDWARRNPGEAITRSSDGNGFVAK